MSEGNLNERLTRALARIDAAVQRIDAAKTAPGLPFGASSGGDPELQARYDALEAEASAALEQLEAVLGTLEKDGAA